MNQSEGSRLDTYLGMVCRQAAEVPGTRTPVLTSCATHVTDTATLEDDMLRCSRNIDFSQILPDDADDLSLGLGGD